MERHDEIKEKSQEISSGLNNSASRQNNTNKSSDLSAEKDLNKLNNKKQMTGFWDKDASNPYRFTPYSEQKNKSEQLDNDSIPKVKGPGVFSQLKEKIFSQKNNSDNGKQKVMILLVPILAVVFVFVLRQVFGQPPRKTKASDKGKSTVSVEDDQSPDKINWKVPEPLPAEMRDITKLGSQDTTSGDNQNIDPNEHEDLFYIRSIVHSADNSSVIIGNQIFHLNEQVNGATIVEIGQDFVVFEKDGVREIKKVAEESLIIPETGINKQDQITVDKNKIIQL